jgi:hypothetical protein
MSSRNWNAAINSPAELQRRADERAGALARIADDARHRGSACERAYDAGLALTSDMTQDPPHAQAR